MVRGILCTIFKKKNSARSKQRNYAFHFMNRYLQGAFSNKRLFLIQIRKLVNRHIPSLGIYINIKSMTGEKSTYKHSTDPSELIIHGLRVKPRD